MGVRGSRGRGVVGDMRFKCQAFMRTFLQAMAAYELAIMDR